MLLPRGKVANGRLRQHRVHPSTLCTFDVLLVQVLLEVRLRLVDRGRGHLSLCEFEIQRVKIVYIRQLHCISLGARLSLGAGDVVSSDLRELGQLFQCPLSGDALGALVGSGQEI
jgi:hypothetical protein